MRHVRDIQSPRVGMHVCFLDAVTLEPFTGTVTDRAGKGGGPIVEAADGSEREFVWAKGDRLQRIASKPWGVHVVRAVDHAHATQAIAAAQARARRATYTAVALAVVSVALVATLILFVGAQAPP